MLLRRVRSVFFWLHLSIGLTAGAVILLMSLTGVLLGFERQAIRLIDGAPAVPVSSSSALLLDDALAAAGISSGDIASVMVRRDPSAPVTVRFHARERAAALLDPFAGEVLPARVPGRGQAFFSALRRWHRWIGASDGALRTRMRAVTGAANLVFLVLVLSGLWLWWPRRWTPARLRATLVPSLGHAGKARDFNWHNSLGFWSAVPLALIIASGAFISYQWPGRWLDRVAGSPEERAAAAAPRSAVSAPAQPPANGARETRAAAERAAVSRAPVAIEPLLAAARAIHPEWQQLTLTIPADDSPTVRIAVAEGNTYRPDLRTTLVLDRSTTAIREVNGYSSLSTSRQSRAWVRFGHTGEVFGVTGQVLATLFSAVGVVLVWTGFALAWRRVAAWWRRDRRGVSSSGRPQTVGHYPPQGA
jgi:uncharacterized iron-regulated membrane protein